MFRSFCRGHYKSDKYFYTYSAPSKSNPKWAYIKTRYVSTTQNWRRESVLVLGRLVSLAPFVLYSSVVVINDIPIKCEQSIDRMIYDYEVAGSKLQPSETSDM